MSDHVDEPMDEHPLANYPRFPPRGEDLPYSDGDKLESGRHADQKTALIQSLRLAWSSRDDFFVGGDMFVYFSETQTRKNDFRGPDVFVVLNTPGHNRKNWVVWEELRTPDVVIELLSPTTELDDRGRKKDIYERILKVARYFVYDPFTYVFDGWALIDGEFVALEPDDDGTLDCAPLGFRLGVRDGNLGGDACPMLMWIDGDGAALPDPYTLAGQALAERERADSLAERVRALEAKLASIDDDGVR